MSLLRVKEKYLRFNFQQRIMERNETFYKGDLTPYATVLGILTQDLIQVDGKGVAWPAYTSGTVYNRVNPGAWVRVADAATAMRGGETLRFRKGQLSLITC